MGGQPTQDRSAGSGSECESRGNRAERNRGRRPHGVEGDSVCRNGFGNDVLEGGGDIRSVYRGEWWAEDAESAILQFLNWDAPNEETFGQDVRLVLVSAEFSKDVCDLAERSRSGHSLRRFRPYALDSRVLLDVHQIIPLSEADEFTIQLKKKAQENRIARTFDLDFSK